MEILIIQTAFIGDIALSVFFANEIKQIFPAATITFISTKIGCQILKCFDFIDVPICFDKRNTHKGWHGIKKISTTLTKKFDYVFALHRSFRTSVLVKTIKANNKIGFDTNALSFVFSKTVKYQKHIHEVFRNRSMLENALDYTGKLDYKKLVTNNITSFKFITNATDKFKQPIVIAPGSVWETKRWLKEYFISLANMLIKQNLDVYLIGASQEEEICKYIADDSGAKSLANKTTIPQVLELIRNSRLVITNDSAPTHFASLFNIPTITIYGATSPSFGFYPLSDNSMSIENIQLFCHPCSIHGSRACPRKNLKCMKSITPDLVFQYAMNILNC